MGLGKGKKEILHSVDLGEVPEDPSAAVMTFGTLADELMPEEFLKSQRELRAEAKLRAILSRDPGRGRLKLGKQALRLRARTRLRNAKRRGQMRSFLQEVHFRHKQGYSEDQLLRSFVPDVGDEVKITEAEVTEEVGRQDCFFKYISCNDRRL